MKSKFIIVSTNSNNGGALVLHNLCRILNELGYDAKIIFVGPIIYKNKLKFWIKYWLHSVKTLFHKSIYFKELKRKIFPSISRNTIVIYPDLIYGNFLHAKKVVRWFLYYNRYDENAYGCNDLFFTYREVFNDYKYNPNCYILNTSYYNLELYKQYNFGDRSGKCFIIRKGKNRTDLPKKFDGEIIDNYSEKEIVDIFNRCEICISYDTQTAYSNIAALCGCVSIVIPEPGKNKSDYIKGDDKTYGVGWGFTKEQIEYSITTREKLVDYYNEINNNAVNSTKEFIKKCDEHFR